MVELDESPQFNSHFSNDYSMKNIKLLFLPGLEDNHLWFDDIIIVILNDYEIERMIYIEFFGSLETFTRKKSLLPRL